MSDYTVRKLNQCRLYNLPIAMSIPTIQDLSIVLTAPHHNPTLLNPDFLTGTGIIPTDWELARPPVISTQGSQIAFKNGVTFLAQPGTITFSQSFAEATPETLDIPTIARKYAATLANLDYQAVSINPKQFVPFEHHPDGARLYITDTLLAPGPWKQISEQPMRASINLVYPLKGRELRVAIAEAQLQRSDDEPVGTVLFAGSFAYSIEGDSPAERLKKLQAAIGNWQADLKTFQKLLSAKFKLGLALDAIADDNPEAQAE